MILAHNWQGGREGRDIDAVELAQAVQELGAGEILLNCIDADGRCAAAGEISGPYFHLATLPHSL